MKGVQFGWHFLRKNASGVPVLRDGTPAPAVGKWLHHKGSIQICESGLHASHNALEALGYVDWGNAVACLVEVRDIQEEESDKFVCRQRKIVAMCDADEVLRVFARESALSVSHLWDMPSVVREYLETGNPELRQQAEDVAWEAVRAEEAVEWPAGAVRAEAAMAAAWAARAEAAWATRAAEAAAEAAWAAWAAWAAGAVRAVDQNQVLEGLLLSAMGGLK